MEISLPRKLQTGVRPDAFSNFPQATVTATGKDSFYEVVCRSSLSANFQDKKGPRIAGNDSAAKEPVSAPLVSVSEARHVAEFFAQHEINFQL